MSSIGLSQVFCTTTISGLLLPEVCAYREADLPEQNASYSARSSTLHIEQDWKLGVRAI